MRDCLTTPGPLMRRSVAHRDGGRARRDAWTPALRFRSPAGPQSARGKVLLQSSTARRTATATADGSVAFRVLAGHLAFRLAVSEAGEGSYCRDRRHVDLAPRSATAPSPATWRSRLPVGGNRSGIGLLGTRASGCAAAAGAGRPLRRGRPEHGRLCPQHHGERRAVALAALHRHAAAVREGQLAHQPQAEAVAAALLGGRVLVALEDALPIGGGIPTPDRGPRCCPAPAPRHDQADRTSLTELQRVGEQVADDLFDGGLVPPAVHGLRGYDDRHTLRAGERRQ